jgi:protoporphyrin/coproporphyrin ferrochelatase
VSVKREGGGEVKGVLIINVGTPDTAEAKSVKPYLKEFLMDPYIIDIPFLLRWILVNILIVPRRASQSAEAYAEIWSPEGSPLRIYLEELRAGLMKNLNALTSSASQEVSDQDMVCVEGAMRYGNPSIPKALLRLQEKGVKEILIVPLYPQYSLAATHTSVEKVKCEVLKMNYEVNLKVFPPFYAKKEFVDSFVKVTEEAIREKEFDFTLFSFHGLPERQIKKTDPYGNHCLKREDCCSMISEKNLTCYRAQSYATAHAIARGLKLNSKQYSVSFQSRLGRTPWIRPYTDKVLEELAQKGVKRLAVVCPAFVADCLETLEEIQIRGKEDFVKAGGEELYLVPSLNAEPIWIEGLSQMISHSL